MSKSLKLIVEALLFASDKPLAMREILGVLPDVKAAQIAGALRVLKYEYEAMGRSFALHEVGGGFQFRSRPEYGAYILKMLQASPARLSRATMETLAVIAYKQPVLRQEIERLRGVDVGGVLKTLLEKGLVKIMGRKNLPGRPLVYGTTRKFLEVFDLKDIESLPKIKELKALGTDEDEQQNLFNQKPGQEETVSEGAPSQEASPQEAPVREEPSPESAG
ncbi:MAG: SMC-Scp complex subunit ScpB [Deltaproteobacteria bacterium]